jgi:hypothetical protein
LTVRCADGDQKQDKDQPLFHNERKGDSEEIREGMEGGIKKAIYF